jgi:hypothetical protein
VVLKKNNKDTKKEIDNVLVVDVGELDDASFERHGRRSRTVRAIRRKVVVVVNQVQRVRWRNSPVTGGNLFAQSTHIGRNDHCCANDDKSRNNMREQQRRSVRRRCERKRARDSAARGALLLRRRRGSPPPADVALSPPPSGDRLRRLCARRCHCVRGPCAGIACILPLATRATPSLHRRLRCRCCCCCCC